MTRKRAPGPLIAAGLAAVAIGCAGRRPAIGGEEVVEDCGPGVCGDPVVVPPTTGAVDLLFVIANSNAIAEEQDLLARQFPRLLGRLHGVPGGFPDLHVGVVSTDLGVGDHSVLTCETPGGDGGALQAGGRRGCLPPAPERYIAVDGLSAGLADVRDTAVTAPPAPAGEGCANACVPGPDGQGDGVVDSCDVSEAFSCVARLGAGGCGFEQPFEAMVRALCWGWRAFDLDGDGEPEWNPPLGYCQGDSVRGANSGFLREDSLLAVVFVSDEDDCSAARSDLFDPSATDRLGPLGSFRCFEHGARCGDRCAYQGCAGGPIPRQPAGLRDCHPVTEQDLGPGEEAYLFPVDRYTRFLRRLRPAEGRLLVAAITGPGDVVTLEQDRRGNTQVAPACARPDAGYQALPGLRFRALVESLNADLDGDGHAAHDGLFGADMGAGICDGDFSPVLDALAERLGATLAPGCIQDPLVGAGGRLIKTWEEAECTVEQVESGGTAEEQRETLPRCRFADRDTESCPAAGASPGRVANLAPGDPGCWYVCDSRGQEGCEHWTPERMRALYCDLGYPFRWQFRLCRDPGCDPAAPAPAGATAQTACLTCNPGVRGSCRLRGRDGGM